VQTRAFVQTQAFAHKKTDVAVGFF